MLNEPQPNKFVPNNFEIVVPESKRKLRNDEPKETKIDEGLFLYHLLDYVHFKPITHLDILLRIKQPENRYNNNQKPKCFLETPKDFALFKVMCDCLDSTVNAKVGYEA